MGPTLRRVQLTRKKGSTNRHLTIARQPRDQTIQAPAVTRGPPTSVAGSSNTRIALSKFLLSTSPVASNIRDSFPAGSLVAMDEGRGLTKVRAATPADAAAVASCLAELGYGTPRELVQDRLAEFDASALDQAFVAVGPSGNILGVAAGHRLPLFHVGGYLVRLTALAVSKSAQGAGAGRMLVAAVEAWAWAGGARRVEVTSGDHRPEAHLFYQAVGYTMDERRFIKHAPAAR